MRIETGDITRPSTEAVVNSANGCGIMGQGVAGALSDVGGDSIEERAKEMVSHHGKPFEPGCCYVTGSGDLRKRGVLKVYHAVTMKFPGGTTSLHYVGQAMKAVLDEALRDGIQSIAFPGLGTGVGRLDKMAVARVMLQTARCYEGSIDISFIDIDKEFIDEVTRFAQKRVKS